MLDSEDTTRVIQWLDDVNPIPMRRQEPYISFEDDTPMQPVIFTGKISDVERYRCMANNNWAIAFPSLIFGPQDSHVHELQLRAASTVFAIGPSDVRSILKSHAHDSVSSTSSSSAGPSRTSTPSDRLKPCKCLSFFYLSSLTYKHIKTPRRVARRRKLGTTETSFWRFPRL